jgi:hypothetical protein
MSLKLLPVQIMPEKTKADKPTAIKQEFSD